MIYPHITSFKAMQKKTPRLSRRNLEIKLKIIPKNLTRILSRLLKIRHRSKLTAPNPLSKNLSLKRPSKPSFWPNPTPKTPSRTHKNRPNLWTTSWRTLLRTPKNRKTSRIPSTPKNHKPCRALSTPKISKASKPPKHTHSSNPNPSKATNQPPKKLKKTPSSPSKPHRIPKTPIPSKFPSRKSPTTTPKTYSKSRSKTRPKTPSTTPSRTT